MTDENIPQNAARKTKPVINNKIAIGFITHIQNKWKERAAAFNDSTEYDYHQFLDYSDKAIHPDYRPSFPEAHTVREILPSSVRAYLGVISYYLQEEKLERKTAIDSLERLKTELENGSLTEKDATHNALCFVDRSRVCYEDLDRFMQTIHMRASHVRESTNNTTATNFEGELGFSNSARTEIIGDAIQEYFDQLKKLGDRPNYYFVFYLKQLAGDLSKGKIKPDDFFRFAGTLETKIHDAQQNLSPEDYMKRGISYDTLKELLPITIPEKTR